MTKALVHPQRYTVDEYFQIDSASEVCHEYFDGRIIDMAAGTDRHSRVTANSIGSIQSRQRGNLWLCRGSDLRIRYGKGDNYGYPDGSIVCAQPEFDSKAPPETTLLNPQVLIEVLSDSTEAYDRGRKFARYREIDSFVEYILIDSERPHVDVYRRQQSELWTLESYEGLKATLPIKSVGIELPLKEIYAGIISAQTERTRREERIDHMLAMMPLNDLADHLATVIQELRAGEYGPNGQGSFEIAVQLMEGYIAQAWHFARMTPEQFDSLTPEKYQSIMHSIPKLHFEQRLVEPYESVI